MLTREEAVAFCLSFEGAYEDYPFDDPNWTVMRRRDTRHGFCWIFAREGRIWLNLKNAPDWGELRRSSFPSVRPAYHMNKEHWSSVILDGTVPREEIEAMIRESYALCGKRAATKNRGAHATGKSGPADRR